MDEVVKMSYVDEVIYLEDESELIELYKSVYYLN